MERLDGNLGPVEVLEDQNEGLSAGDPGQRAGQHLEDLDPILSLLLLPRGRDPRIAAHGRSELADLGKLREEADEVCGEVGKVGPLGGRAP